MTKAFAYLKNPWVLLFIAALVIVVLVYAKDWNPFDFFKPAPDSADVVGDESQKAYARALATELHNEMLGINISRNLAPWQQFMQELPFTQKLVYQEFSSMYASEGKGTLTAWVKAESSLFPVWTDSVAGRAQVLAKLQSLGLS